MTQLIPQTTDILNLLSLYGYAFIILCIIAYKTWRNEDHGTAQSRLFRTLLGLNAILLVVDGLSTWGNGFAGGASRTFLTCVSIANLSLQTLMTFVWFLFVCEVSLVKRNREAYRKLLTVIPLITVLLILFLTPLFSTGFSYDELNRYRRTIGTYFIIAVDFAYILRAYAVAIRSRRLNGRKKTLALMSFALPPALCGLIQIFLPAITLVWPALSISLLINYLAIQNEQLFLDHLTGVNNRRSLDIALRRKLNASQRSGSFGLLFIDLDEFKTINDTYGHIEGDKALEATARLLQRCFHNSDFISRYGGDEFLVIVDLRDERDLVAIKKRLEDQLAGWNESSGNPWKIAFSVGSVICAPGTAHTPDHYLRQIDALLYEHKRGKKAPQYEASLAE
jgi:diguanylate cyclase (GGDEF)-like protein